MIELFNGTLLVFYILTAVLFALLTYTEGRKTNRTWTFYRIFGLSLSLVWPLAIILIAALVAHGGGRKEKLGKFSGLGEPQIL